jgi:hypothetical protein
MAFLPQNITSQNVEDVLANAGNGPQPLIPDGIYKAILVKTELKDTKSGGKYLAAHFVITDGQHKNVELIDRINIVNDNPTATKIGIETLARIVKAIGLPAIPQNTDTMHGKKLLIETVTEAGKPWINKDGVEQEGKDKSAINSKGHKPLADAVPDAAPSQTAQAAPASMPWQQG